MIYDLPKTVFLRDTEVRIRWDYKSILDICIALGDQNLSDNEKGLVALNIFYPDFDSISPVDYQEALEKCFWFINCGNEDTGPKSPKLVDWEQDFQMLCAPINRIVGKEIRGLNDFHWWSFISAYYEIGGDCTFAQIVSIRDKNARGKPLDKFEREWYRRNRNLVDFKSQYTDAEQDLLKKWIGK